MPAGILAASPLLSGKEQKGTTGKAGAPHLTVSRPGSVRRGVVHGAGLSRPYPRSGQQGSTVRRI